MLNQSANRLFLFSSENKFFYGQAKRFDKFAIELFCRWGLDNIHQFYVVHEEEKTSLFYHFPVELLRGYCRSFLRDFETISEEVLVAYQFVGHEGRVLQLQ